MGGGQLQSVNLCMTIPVEEGSENLIANQYNIVSLKMSNIKYCYVFFTNLNLVVRSKNV